MVVRIINRRSFMKKTAGAGAAALLLQRYGRGAEPAGEDGLAAIANDPLRPSYHLLPQHNWMNDPNGPIWWKGNYHLFYQLNPHAAVWGDMHWGHAVSPDMVHWRHEPIALAPTPGGADSEGCFSGSAVVFNGVPTFHLYRCPECATRPGDHPRRQRQAARDPDAGHRRGRRPAALEKAGDARYPLAAARNEGDRISRPLPLAGRGRLVPGHRVGRAWQGRLACCSTARRTCASGTTCMNSPPASPTARWPPTPATAAKCGSARISSRSVTRTTCTTPPKAKSSGQPANTTKRRTPTPPDARACSITGRITHPRAFWRPTGGASCGDGSRRHGPRRSSLPPDGPAACRCRAF